MQCGARALEIDGTYVLVVKYALYWEGTVINYYTAARHAGYSLALPLLATLHSGTVEEGEAEDVAKDLYVCHFHHQ